MKTSVTRIKGGLSLDIFALETTDGKTKVDKCLKLGLSCFWFPQHNTPSYNTEQCMLYNHLVFRTFAHNVLILYLDGL